MKQHFSKQSLHTAAAIFLSILVAIALFSNRNVAITDAKSFLGAVNGNGVGAFCVVLGATLLFKKIFFIRERRVVILATIGALILSVCHVAGYAISTWGTLWKNDSNFWFVVLEGAVFAGTFFLFYALLSLLFQWAITAKKISVSHLQPLWFACNRRSFFVVMGVLLAVWSVYYVFFFPGIVTWDSYYQIEQGMGFRPLTDENPFLHTLIVGAFVRFGTALFGTIPDGIALYIAFQLLLLAAATSFVLLYMAKRQIHIGFRIGLLCYFAINPIVAAYSVTQWKDIWLAYFLLLYIVFLIEIAVNKENFFSSVWRVLALIGVIIGFLLSKGTGILMLILSLPFLWICAKKYYKQLLVVTLASLTVFGVVREVIIPGFGIIKGHVREPLSVPLQQIARTVQKHGDDLTDEQRQIISEILPYDRLPELYNPKLSDPVKGELNEDVFQRNIGRYAKCWLEIGLKHPKTYLESFLANSYGYWYPETRYWQISSNSYYDILFMYRDNGWKVYDSNVNNYEVDAAGENRRSSFVEKYHELRNIPGVSMLFSIGFYFWIALVLALLCILKKRYALLLPFCVLFAVFLTCVMSPVYAECRYAYTIFLACPILIPFVLQDDLVFTKNMGIDHREKNK